MANPSPGAAYSVTVRLEYDNQPGMLGRITSSIGDAGGDIEAVDVVRSNRQGMCRDVTVNARDVDHGQAIVAMLRAIPGVRLLNYSDPTFLLHLGGKISIESKIPIRTRNDLSLAYTPGVGRVSMAIYDRPEAAWSLTTKGRAVAIVTDGSAVLGLGNIGPEAALPVMEGKAMLFKELADINAWPICLATQETDEIVDTVKRIAPGFGGINLEDIAAPRCFEVEERLRNELDIPVFHDDQHGSSITVFAALLNALRVVGRELSDLRIVMVGAGSGGSATARLLTAAGAKNIVGFDVEGALHRGGDYGGHAGKQWFAENANPDAFTGTLAEALTGANLFIGFSGPGVLGKKELALMADDAIVFALANPDPEVFPEEAPPNVRVMATGRSDYPNQINNALCFPGFFRGLLDAQATGANHEMEVAAAKAIASAVPSKQLNEEYIVPNVFDKNVARAVAKAVADTAQRTGVARRRRGGRVNVASLSGRR